MYRTASTFFFCPFYLICAKHIFPMWSVQVLGFFASGSNFSLIGPTTKGFILCFLQGALAHLWLGVIVGAMCSCCVLYRVILHIREQEWHFKGRTAAASQRGGDRLRMLIALEETDGVYAVRVLHSNMNMLHGWLQQKPVMPAYITKITQQHKKNTRWQLAIKPQRSLFARPTLWCYTMSATWQLDQGSWTRARSNSDFSPFQAHRSRDYWAPGLEHACTYFTPCSRQHHHVPDRWW